MTERKKARHLCVMPGCRRVAMLRVEGKDVCEDHRVDARLQGAELRGMLQAIAAIELIERNLPESPIRDIQENTLQIVTRNLRKAIEQQMTETETKR